MHYGQRGVWCAAVAYVQTLQGHGVAISMADVGAAWQNGYAERLIRRPKRRWTCPRIETMQKPIGRSSVSWMMSTCTSGSILPWGICPLPSLSSSGIEPDSSMTQGVVS